MTEQYGSARRIPRAPRPLNTARQAPADLAAAQHGPAAFHGLKSATAGRRGAPIPAGRRCSPSLRRFVASSLLLCAPVLLNLGGCPPQDAMNGLNDGTPATSNNNSGPASPRDDLAPAGDGIGEAPASGHAQFATVQGAPLQFVLRPEGTGAEIRPITQPAAGSLDGPEPQSDGAARFMWTPPADFVGQVEFAYVVRLDGVESDVGTVTIVVYPEVRFSVLSVASDVGGLTVEATARTVGGHALPDGDYAWSFGGEQDSGPMSSHASRSYTFTRGGTHAVTLTLTLAGLSAPYGCRSAGSGQLQANISVPPALSGVVADDSGQPLAGVRLTASGGATADTDSDGRYVLRVPYGWSGDVTPVLSGWSFEPLARSYSGVVADGEGEGFVGYNNEVRNVLSGYVRDEAGRGLGGVRVTGTGGASTTESAPDGGFSVSIPRRWSGVLTPSHPGLTFNPPSRAYSDVMRALGGQNFTGLTDNVTIQGYVRRADSSPIPGVTLTLSNGGGSGRTNEQGYYAVEAPPTWAGRITPSAEGYSFDPAYRDYGGSGAGGEGENFIGIPDNPGGGNLPPVAVDQNAQTLEDTPVLITLNGSDPDNDPLQWVVTSLPEFGTLVDPNGSSSPLAPGALPYVLLAPPGGGSGNQIRFVPKPDCWNDGNPPERFGFVVFDGELYSEPDATVSVTITGVNDPPRIEQGSSVSLAVAENSQRGNAANQFQLSAVDPDAVTNGLNWSIVSGPSHGVAGILGQNPGSSGQPVGFDYEPAPGYRGADEFVVRVTDNVGESASVEVVVTVGGVGISGSIALVPTVGHRPPIGEQELLFRGTGGWAGMDFTARTEVSGAYLQVVPEGWTGELVAADPDRLLLMTPERREYAQPVVSPLSGQDFECWTPPIGIPMPSFGIKETHWMYAGQRFDFDGDGVLEPGEEYRDAGNGPYTHYVDNTHPETTDSNNAFGTASRPRRTLPNSLAAGSVLELHGGPYAYGPGYIPLSGAGTSDFPIFVRGIGSPRLAIKLALVRDLPKSHMILEGINAYSINCVAPADHVSIRNCDVSGDLTGGGVSVVSYSPPATSTNVILFNNTIHDNGDVQSTVDQDVHAVSVTAHVDTLWVIDNTMYRCSGDGMQINAGSLANMPTTHSIYAGRNHVYECRQAGLWAKQSTDVIFSQNLVHDIIPVSWSEAKGLGYQYGPERVWFLFNEVHDCEVGIAAQSTSGLGDGQDSYVIGNVLHRIHTAGAYNGNSAWSPAAIRMVGVPNKYILNNTIYDCDAGINGASSGMYYMLNNIIANVSRPEGCHVFIESGTAQSVLAHSLLFQAGEPVRIRWGTQTYDLRTFQVSTGNGHMCSVADPSFANASVGDFQLGQASPAIDAGRLDAVYADFGARYGLTIQRDHRGRTRPQAAAVDCGAFER